MEYLFFELGGSQARHNRLISEGFYHCLIKTRATVQRYAEPSRCCKGTQQVLRLIRTGELRAVLGISGSGRTTPVNSALASMHRGGDQEVISETVQVLAFIQTGSKLPFSS